ncbi:hypothetical protein ABFS83_14G235800 [Erythranthe nasuta]
MQRLNKLTYMIHIVFLIVMKMFFLYPSSSASEETLAGSYSCGGIIVKPPVITNKENSSLLLICKSDKLYFRTTVGGLLLHVSSIDYTHKHLTISHTSSSYANKSNYNNINVRGLIEEELGTRISFDIPYHVPNPCNECEKPYGNCGVGLRCVCHPKLCRDKVISGGGAVMKPCCDVLLVLFIVLGFFRGF